MYIIISVEDAQPTNERLPDGFRINLKRVNCNGNETMLAECPHMDTICLRPGAGVVCPREAQLLTTSSVTSTTTAAKAATTATEIAEGKAMIQRIC